MTQQLYTFVHQLMYRVQDSQKLGGITGCSIVVGLSRAKQGNQHSEIATVHNTLEEALNNVTTNGATPTLIQLRDQLDASIKTPTTTPSLYATVLEEINSSKRQPYETTRRVGARIVNEAINRRMKQGALTQTPDIIRNDYSIIENAFTGRRER